MSGDGASRRLQALEKKLIGLVASEQCSLCQTRTSTCSECGRPQGPYQGQREELLAIIDARLTNLAERTPTDEQIAQWWGDLS
jgi:hypothetical protein